MVLGPLQTSQIVVFNYLVGDNKNLLITTAKSTLHVEQENDKKLKTKTVFLWRR